MRFDLIGSQGMAEVLTIYKAIANHMRRVALLP